MSEQKNSAPRPLNDEELEAATGGAAGFNPLYGLSGDPYSPVPSALVVTGSNPLYVAPAEPYIPPALPQAHAPAPQPAPAPEPEPTVIMMTNDAFGGGSLNIAAPVTTNITLTGTVTVTGSTTVEIPPETKPEVTVMTFGTPQGTFTEVIPTVRGVRPAGESNNNDRIAAGGSLSPLESAFDLGLVRT